MLSSNRQSQIKIPCQTHGIYRDSDTIQCYNYATSTNAPWNPSLSPKNNEGVAQLFRDLVSWPSMRTHDLQLALIILSSLALGTLPFERRSHHIHKSHHPIRLPSINLTNSYPVTKKSYLGDLVDGKTFRFGEEDLKEPIVHSKHPSRPQSREVELIQNEQRTLRVVNPDVESVMGPSQDPPPFDAKLISGEHGLRTEFIPIGGGKRGRKSESDGKDVKLQIRLKLGPHLIPALEYGKSLSSPSSPCHTFLWLFYFILFYFILFYFILFIYFILFCFVLFYFIFVLFQFSIRYVSRRNLNSLGTERKCNWDKISLLTRGPCRNN